MDCENININNNISFFLNELDEDKDENEDEINRILELDEFIPETDWFINSGLDYDNYTIKELLRICEYYDIDKSVKASKCKKQDIVATILYYEQIPENIYIVNRRQQLWSYMKELSNDSKMKKYVIWK